MSRTFRHSNRDTKVLRGRVINLFRKGNCRNQSKLKNGLIADDQWLYINYMFGHDNFKIKKTRRKEIIKRKRSKLKQELSNSLKNEEKDFVTDVVDNKIFGSYYLEK